jgi:hypothetical protein
MGLLVSVTGERAVSIEVRRESITLQNLDGEEQHVFAYPGLTKPTLDSAEVSKKYLRDLIAFLQENPEYLEDE